MRADPKLTLTRYKTDRLDDIRSTLIDVYAEVYAREIAEDPFYSVERFEDRLKGHVAAPNWEAVVGEVDGEVVGYAYGYALRAGKSWWTALRTPVGDDSLTDETGSRTFGLAEIMVKAPWRGTGIARTIHDELLSHRTEERAALLVNPAHSRVLALYERWGYSKFGEIQPFPDSPRYNAMMKPLREG
jgi:GNAT superfamily N-acetyltransferase